MSEVNYAKLKDGNWGLRSETKLKAGKRTTVTKKNGEQREETVGELVYDGETFFLYRIVRGEHNDT